MTDVATRAVQAAVHFEAKKTGFGQAQDGWSLTLRIAHLDMPPAVRDAAKGTRYIVALVEIGDDEEPIIRESATVPSAPGKVVGGAASGVQAVAAPPSSLPESDDAKVKRKLREMPYPQRAGMLLHDEDFWRYLNEYRGYTVKDAKDADAALKIFCGITSKTELATNIDAAERFQDLEDGLRGCRARGEFARDRV